MWTKIGWHTHIVSAPLDRRYIRTRTILPLSLSLDISIIYIYSTFYWWLANEIFRSGHCTIRLLYVHTDFISVFALFYGYIFEFQLVCPYYIMREQIKIEKMQTNGENCESRNKITIQISKIESRLVRTNSLLEFAYWKIFDVFFSVVCAMRVLANKMTGCCSIWRRELERVWFAN